VYLKYHHDRSLVVTELRKFKGDTDALHRAVQTVVGVDTLTRIRPGRIEVRGDFKKPLQEWLEAIGY
jgi:hypothetical protein